MRQDQSGGDRWDRWLVRAMVVMLLAALGYIAWIYTANAQDLRLPPKETAIQITPQGKVVPVPRASVTERTNASAAVVNFVISWTPTDGSTRHELYYWTGLKWQIVGTSPDAKFTFAPPPGVYRWMVVDVMPSGLKVFQINKGSWTYVPY
jgi:hypothetical protein